MFAFANQFALRCRVFFLDVRLFGTAIITTARRGAATSALGAEGARAVLLAGGANAATCDNAESAANAANVFIAADEPCASSGASASFKWTAFCASTKGQSRRCLCYPLQNGAKTRHGPYYCLLSTADAS